MHSYCWASLSPVSAPDHHAAAVGYAHCNCGQPILLQAEWLTACHSPALVDATEGYPSSTKFTEPQKSSSSFLLITGTFIYLSWHEFDDVAVSHTLFYMEVIKTCITTVFRKLLILEFNCVHFWGALIFKTIVVSHMDLTVLGLQMHMESFEWS